MKLKTILLTIILLVVVAVVSIFFIAQVMQQTPGDEDYQQAFNNAYRIYAPSIDDKVTFCGEEISTDRIDIREALDRELLANVYWQSNLILYFKRANRFFPVIEPILKKQGVPDDFKYLALIESGLTNVVSPAKAAGYWQFLKETGIEMGLEINDDVDMRYDITASTEAACKYLKAAYQQHGSWTAAAAAYNMGNVGFEKNATTQQTANYFDLRLNSETARYLYRIIAVKLIFEKPQQYGVMLRPKDLYQPYHFQSVSVDSTINNLVDFAKQHQISYKQLKDYNPWLRSSKLSNKYKKTYKIAIPSPQDVSYKEQSKHLDNSKLIERL